MRQLWRDHSLTIILAAIGIALTGLAIAIIWPLTPERWFDLLSGAGVGALTVALFYTLSNIARERAKPED